MSDSKSILFIDGRATDRNFYADRLKLSCPEFVIHQAATGQAGLALYQSHSIDCVVLELALPDPQSNEQSRCIANLFRSLSS